VFYRGLHEGRRLMADPDTPSYAAELEVLSKDEVRKRMHIPASILLFFRFLPFLF